MICLTLLCTSGDVILYFLLASSVGHRRLKDSLSDYKDKKEMSNCNSSDLYVAEERVDLISMAERGRIGKKCLSEDGSYASESMTPETEEEPLVPCTSKQHPRPNKLNLVKVFEPSHHPLPKQTTLIKKADHLDQNGGIRESIKKQSLEEIEDKRTKPMFKRGSLEVSHAYDPASCKLYVKVLKIRELPFKERNTNNQIFVKIIILPQKRHKAQTNPRFVENGDLELNDKFCFNCINPDDIPNYGIRYRLFALERTKQEHFIGESIISFLTYKPFQQESRLLLNLEIRPSFQVS